MELLKVSKDQRALKFIKKRVGDTHPGQEEETGAEQHLCSHEEISSPEGLSPMPSGNKTCSEKNKIKEDKIKQNKR